MPEKLPTGIYKRGEILWARFKVRGVEYRESLRTRSVAVAERRLKVRKQEVEDQSFFGAAAPVSSTTPCGSDSCRAAVPRATGDNGDVDVVRPQEPLRPGAQGAGKAPCVVRGITQPQVRRGRHGGLEEHGQGARAEFIRTQVATD